jgi:ABC-type bacteriocin/lantibiotic exporter with double-glycine peptidase domain
VLAGTQLIITESMLISMSVVAILLYNAKVFVLLLLVLLPAVIVLAWFTRKRIKSVRKHVKESGEKALQYLKEALSGFVETSIYGKNDFFVNRFSTYQGRLNGYLSDLQVTQGIPSRMIEVVAVLGLFIFIAINKSGTNYSSGNLIGIGAFMAAAYKIIPGIVRIFNTSGQVKAYSFTMNELLGLNADQNKSKYSKDEVHLRSFRFEDVSFSHDLKILEQFCMQLRLVR